MCREETEEAIVDFVLVSTEDGIVTMTLNRGKVNALNESVIQELRDTFTLLKSDEAVKAIILTGNGSFFSFGFDIPEFLNVSRDDFERFLINFTNLYSYVFLFPKPVIAAINGHTIAGGCMIALACDYRLMVSGKAKISLNEITFGASVFAGCVEMLKGCVGQRKAQEILYSGALYTAEEAFGFGLIDRVTSLEKLTLEAERVAHEFAGKHPDAFGSIKRLLRDRSYKMMKEQEMDSIREFVEIWYSDETWANLQDIKIHP